MVKVPVAAARSATPRQRAFIRTLYAERSGQLSAEYADRLRKLAIRTERSEAIPFDLADKAIKWVLKHTERPPRFEDDPDNNEALRDEAESARFARPRGKVPAPIGVYVKDGAVYLVRASKQNPQRRLAVQLVEGPPRMTENGEKATFHHERALGMVYELTEADKMADADLRDYMIRHSQCVNCHKHIYAERTLRKGVTPLGLMGRTCARRLGYLPPVKHRTPNGKAA